MDDNAERYAGIKAGGGIADLSSRAKFRLTGADRVRYLNGQLTNDVRKLAPGESVYACVTTAKGKMSGDVFVTSGADFFLLDADASLRETLAARLERYIIADDVVLEDATSEYGLLYFADGSEVRNTFAQEGSTSATLRIDGMHRFGTAGTGFFGLRESIQVLQAAFISMPIIDLEMQEILRIEAGIPRWGFELTEDTLPPEAGLDRTAIDYQKGCYIGQEVISRLRSVGHVNKVLRGFVADAPLTRAMQLFHEDKPAGWLTSAAYSFGLDSPVALGYLKRGVDAPTLVARTPGGGESCTVEVRELPLIP